MPSSIQSRKSKGRGKNTSRMIDRTNLKPLLRPKKKSKAIRTHIRKQSRRRAKESALYAKLRDHFLSDHPYCQHWLAENYGGIGEVEKMEQLFMHGKPDFMIPRSCEIHHRKGRGRFYLDTSTWMAVRAGHEEFIHKDPKRYEKGYCLPRR